jgi:hypothetical protein
MKTMNEIEKNSKLRVLFLAGAIAKGYIYRCHAPYADVSDTLGLRPGGGGQKQPKMTKNSKK